MYSDDVFSLFDGLPEENSYSIEFTDNHFSAKFAFQLSTEGHCFRV